MNGVPPELIRRTRQAVDVDDLAATFAEEEIGRFDFKNNWEAMKGRTDIQQRVQLWLDQINVDNSPDEVIAAIDRLAASRPGRWS
jgi:hypothetical protein